MINEGARILDEGFALRAADIDVIYNTGNGFPGYHGGPMWYADEVGVKKIYARILEFEKQHGELWSPSPLFEAFSQNPVGVCGSARVIVIKHYA